MIDGSFSAGEVLVGRFRLHRFLARGGMGEVYEAEDTELGERVAVKVVRPDIADDAEVMARFRKEVQLARRVTHPSVCRIYDLSRHPEGNGEVTLLSMELLQGESLAQRLAREGALPRSEAGEIARQVVGGLEAAHAKGIVHGDLKSSNVVLVDEPTGQRVVVTDFGLARLASEAGARRQPHLRPLMGSLASLAPETLRGEPPGPAADLYALGVLLFEVVTGRLPFSGGDATEMAAARLVEAPPSPRRWVPDLEPRWEQTILRCLATEPEDRFARPQQVLEALGLADPATPVASPVRGVLGRRPRLRVPVLGLAVLGLVLVAALAWRPGAPEPEDMPRPPAEETHAVPPVLAELAQPALDASENRLAARPEAEAFYREGMQLHSEFKEAAAIELFERAVELDPSFAMAWARLASAYRNLGRPGSRDLAARALEFADQLTPAERHAVEGLFHLGRFHETEAAIRSFRQALAFKPDDLTARHNLAIAYSFVERFDEALAEQRRLVAQDSENVLSQGNLAVFLVQTGRVEEAEERLAELIASLPHNPAPSVQRGFLRLSQGDVAGAWNDLTTALDLHPGLPSAELGRCMARLMTDDPVGALAQAPRTEHSMKTAAALTTQACRQLALALAGRSEQALAESATLASAVATEHRPMVVLWRAGLHLGRGEAAVARRLADTARTAAVGSWVEDLALLVAGRAALAEGRVDVARARWEVLQSHRELAPQIARYADLLEADLLLAAGKPQAASALLTAVEAGLPQPLGSGTSAPPSGHVLVWELRARVETALGNDASAAAAWQRIADAQVERVLFPAIYRRSLERLAGRYRIDGEAARARQLEQRRQTLDSPAIEPPSTADD